MNTIYPLTGEVFQHYYPQLLAILPMNDATFISKLYSVQLLPGNIKSQVESQPTQADKAVYFLDHVIKPSVTSGIGRSFENLLTVMEDSEHDGVKELAKMMRNTPEKNQSNVLFSLNFIIFCVHYRSLFSATWK